MSAYKSVKYTKCIHRDYCIDPLSPYAENYRWCTLVMLKHFIKNRDNKLSRVGNKTVLMERLAKDAADEINKRKIVLKYQELFQGHVAVCHEEDENILFLYKIKINGMNYLVDPLTSLLYSKGDYPERICKYNPITNKLLSI
jgi:hypothetical protein